ncbi:MAG: squalene synthase HpnC [Rhodocyclaceae bacterium]|nr:squalene synthase HpnC [Rhodocyclaceae bacterium]
MASSPSVLPTLPDTGHYENFPVASLLLPKQLREPVAAIYRFARCADDIADEGNARPESRLVQLQAYEDALTAITTGRPVPVALAPVFQPLRKIHERLGLPLAPCHALLSAFMQDVNQTRYASYTDLLDYCARSANPVGHLMLFLFEADTPQNRVMSDAICSALQLTNHWQDIAVDARKGSTGRIYLPQDELTLWGYTDADILSGDCVTRSPERWAEFMAFQTNRVRALFDTGRALPGVLGCQSWRIGQELRLTVAGGRRILNKIETARGDVFAQRPTLNWADWLRLMVLG